MQEIKFNKIYARTRQDGTVIHIFSEQFESPQLTDVLIDSTNIDRHGAQKYSVIDENGYYNYTITNGTLTARDKTQDIEMTKLTELRHRRANECFSIINRGTLWYDTLTDQQKQELTKWYKDWLDVTKTLVIPNTPNFIENV